MIEKVIEILKRISEEKVYYTGYDYRIEDREDAVVIDMIVNKEEFNKKWKETKC